MEQVNSSQKQIEPEFEGLPSLCKEESKQKRKNNRGRLRNLKCKAISMPVDKIGDNKLNMNRYIISDHYYVFEKLGIGAYSEVRRAVSRDTEQVVAIKIARGTTSAKYLKNEAEIMRLIQSEHLPKFYMFAHDQVTKKAYLAMEYIEGKTLDQYVNENGVLTEEEANLLIVKLINAVETLHKHGIAHRDIKPQNIIITNDKDLKLIDLNISKRFKKNSVDESLEDSQGDASKSDKFHFFTQISSPMYAAPEILSFNCYTESIDIWGIGIAYAEMLFKLSELFNIDKDIKEAKNISAILDDIDSVKHLSEETLSKLKSMCSKDPEERPDIFEVSELFK